MKRMQWFSILALWVPCLMLSACATFYQKATGDFADVTSVAVASMRSTLDDSRSLCILERRVDWLQKVVTNPATNADEKKAYLSLSPITSSPQAPTVATDDAIRVAVTDAADKIRTSGACVATEVDAEAFGKALNVISEWAVALKDLSSKASYSSSNIKDAGDALSAMKGQGAGTAGQILSGINEPVQLVVNAIFAGIASKKIGQTVIATRPQIDRILTLVDAIIWDDYQRLQKLHADVAWLQKNLHDQLVASKSAEPVGIVIYFELSSRLFDQVDEVQRRRRAAHEVVVNLSKAMAELGSLGPRKVGDLKPQDTQEFLSSIGKVTDGIATLRTLHQ